MIKLAGLVASGPQAKQEHISSPAARRLCEQHPDEIKLSSPPLKQATSTSLKAASSIDLSPKFTLLPSLILSNAAAVKSRETLTSDETGNIAEVCDQKPTDHMKNFSSDRIEPSLSGTREGLDDFREHAQKQVLATTCSESLISPCSSDVEVAKPRSSFNSLINPANQEANHVAIPLYPSVDNHVPSIPSLQGQRENHKERTGTDYKDLVNPLATRQFCGHPAISGQELCYLCHQRRRYNVYINCSEENRRRAAEEAELLLEYQRDKTSLAATREKVYIIVDRVSPFLHFSNCSSRIP
ncbi:unnamed protein product [Protopolystoma xenopodis]|uniref:Uncharacterized protein n=1 Tax=Protopolystoma xenopodis TaxID=117903 RepID=A0A3S4ZXB4_9PLAT|nr:unnamed protein product [Protopolystoma xenopodis]